MTALTIGSAGSCKTEGYFLFVLFFFFFWIAHFPMQLHWKLARQHFPLRLRFLRSSDAEMVKSNTKKHLLVEFIAVHFFISCMFDQRRDAACAI